ncbi:hypothetical protein ABZ990_19720 [Streptomyces sp. NPDC046203]|uniref:hypothetical protein n=1 Tax=Streptomyces sp. NPDC046203 TaxID=3154602 RepID=UPI0033FF21B7
MIPHDEIVTLRDRSQSTMGAGIFLLVLAGLLWAWCALLLLVPYTGSGSKMSAPDCEALIGAPYEQLHAPYGRGACVEERDWPELLGILALSLPFATAGGMTYARGAATRRICVLLLAQHPSGE